MLAVYIPDVYVYAIIRMFSFILFKQKHVAQSVHFTQNHTKRSEFIQYRQEHGSEGSMIPDMTFLKSEAYSY